MTTNTATTKAQREYDIAVNSLVNAELLSEILSAHVDEAHDNGYLADAIQRAQELVEEMNRNLDDVMARFTPEQCGL